MQKTTRASSMADDCNHMLEKTKALHVTLTWQNESKVKKNSLCFGCHLCAKPKIGSSTSQVCRSSFCFLYLAWLQKSHLKSQISKEVCRSSKGLLRPSSKMELHACPTKMQPSWISTICDGYIHHFPKSIQIQHLCPQFSTICPSPCSNHLLPVDGLFIRLLDIETHGP